MIQKMHYFRWGLLFVCIIAFVLNSIGTGKDEQKANQNNFQINKTKVHIIISVNWTGSITRIGEGYDSKTYYLTQLRSVVKDEIESFIKKNISDEKEIYVSYISFGLVQPYDDTKIPSPDFKSNYIKIFKTERKGFKDQDWTAFLTHLRRSKKGYHTALTVAEQFSAVQTAKKIKDPYDENYLFLVTDDYFNVPSGSEISRELADLRDWNSHPVGNLKNPQKIKNISYAGKISNTFFHFYRIENLLNKPLLPHGLSEDQEHFIIRFEKIEPVSNQIPSNFLTFPDEITYEYLSNTKIRIPISISFNKSAIKNEKYINRAAVFSVIDKKSANCIFQKVSLSDDLIKRLIIPAVSDRVIDIKIDAYYDYQDENIFPIFQEKHTITIPCRRIKGGRLLYIFPVNGALLSIHKFSWIIKGQKNTADFWNFIFLLTLIAWGGKFLKPYILPSTPNVKYTIVKGDESA